MRQIRRMTMCVMVAQPSGEHLCVPMITRSSNQSGVWSEDVLVRVLTSATRAVHELLLLTIWPLLVTRRRTKPYHPWESASL